MRAPVFSKCDGGKFEIGDLALQHMLRFIQDASEKPEAGGVLLGRHIISCSDIVLDEITVPMDGDCRKHSRFFRSRKAHQEAIDRTWYESDGTCVYLGEWHTHLEADPEPSRVDLRNWRHRLFRDLVHSDALYFVIMGTSLLGVWEVTRHRFCCTLLGTYAHTE